jgi:TPR repeat protein
LTRTGGIGVTLAAAVAALGLAGSAAAQEAEARPGVGAVMDQVFGAGTWRLTGGYRTPERENELRAQGAMTVPAGVLSHHSMGGPGAPGAYDVVVAGVSPSAAAARLRSAGAPFRLLLAEGAHGTQGAHVHVEPGAVGARAAGLGPPAVRWTVSDPTPAEQALIALHDRSARGDAEAQLRLGRLYAEGRGAPRDLVAAVVWTGLAAANRSADQGQRQGAERLLAELAGKMKPDELARARRFVGAPADAAGCGAPRLAGFVVLIGAAAASPAPAPAGAGCASAAG